MSYLAHKISRAKWVQYPYMRDDDVSADALTACLKTSDNKLSFWSCESNSMTDVDRVALALGAGMQRIDTFDIVLIPRSVFDSEIYNIENTTGRTAAVDLKDHHVDLVRLTARSLCQLAPVISSYVHDKTTCYRITRSQMRSLLEQAIQLNRIELTSLSEKISQQIGNPNL